MTATLRPLPTMIGPTENALRALLVSLLEGAQIDTYEEWVVLNGVAGAADDDPVRAIASGLQRSPGDVALILDSLGERGLVDHDGARWTPTVPGAELLARLRAVVSSTTARLVDGIDDDDVTRAREVLDTVRRRALDELGPRAVLAPGS